MSDHFTDPLLLGITWRRQIFPTRPITTTLIC